GGWRIAWWSGSVGPPGTPNTCRTRCSASGPAKSAPPCWLRGRSGTGRPEQPGRGAAEHGFFAGAKAQRAHLADRVVTAHIKRAVRPEEDLPGTGEADQVRQEVTVVGDGVVVEPAQRGVRAGADPGPRFRPDRERPAQPPPDHRPCAAAVRRPPPQPRVTLQHPAH